MINEKLCRFYSPNWLGDLLVATLVDLQPNSVVDLGCGPGSLSDAAAKRWPKAEITTVDVDPVVAALRSNGTGRCRHIFRDVLDDGLQPAASVQPGSIDLVISNPPYTLAQRSPSIENIMRRAGFGDVILGWTKIPTNLAFLAQALALVRSGGTVAFVVPDTLISSESMRSARQLLIEKHCVQTVIQLPRKTFVRTDALTFIVVLKKNGRSDKIRLLAVDNVGNLETNIEIGGSEGVHRLDCLYHHMKVSRLGQTTLAELGVKVSRGRSDSRKVASAKGEIFHTSDFPDRPGCHISLGSNVVTVANPSGVIAEAGDILMARVDRRLERKVALVSDGTAEISDCVLRLRVPATARGRVLAGLVSEDGCRQIAATSRGTGARHISHDAVLAIRV